MVNGGFGHDLVHRVPPSKGEELPRVGNPHGANLLLHNDLIKLRRGEIEVATDKHRPKGRSVTNEFPYSIFKITSDTISSDRAKGARVVIDRGSVDGEEGDVTFHRNPILFMNLIT